MIVTLVAAISRRAAGNVLQHTEGRSEPGGDEALRLAVAAEHRDRVPHDPRLGVSRVEIKQRRAVWRRLRLTHLLPAG